jgi:hypothetical protein
MKLLTHLIFASLTILFTSCAVLTSNTIIEPNNSFILGNNQHGKFNVKLKNTSQNDLIIHLNPINGGQHSFETVKPNKKLKVFVDKNTALVIDNQSSNQASVDLFVKGDVGLSMGYKK